MTICRHFPSKGFPNVSRNSFLHCTLKKSLISPEVWFIVCTTIVRSHGEATKTDGLENGLQVNFKDFGRMVMTKWLKDVLVELHREDSGQDLIEYALIAALIALAATVGMGVVANAINDAFSSIGEKLKTYTS